MAYLDNYALLSNPNLNQRTKIAVIKAAHFVLAGGSTDEKILAAAKQAVAFPDQSVNWFMTYIVMDETIAPIGEAATDANIQFVVDSKFEQLWGA